MPFQKGISGNPGGRPKREWTWAGLIEEAVNEELTTVEGNKDKAKKFITKRLVKMAIDGDIQAQKEIMNRMDGLPHQTTDITSAGKPLPIFGGTSVQNAIPKDDSNSEDIQSK